MAYAEKRGKGPRPWRVKYKVPGGEASESGFETKQAALVWGRDQEAKVRAGTWNDPAAGEITVSEWIERWKATQDVGLSTTENREYLIGRFIRPYWGVYGSSTRSLARRSPSGRTACPRQPGCRAARRGMRAACCIPSSATPRLPGRR